MYLMRLTNHPQNHQCKPVCGPALTFQPNQPVKMYDGSLTATFSSLSLSYTDTARLRKNA